MSPPRLLVGVGDAGDLTAPRLYLLELVTGLRALDVDVQVVTFEVGEVGHALFKVADVRSFATVDPLAGAGRLERLALRRRPGRLDARFDAAAAADLAWLRPPDAVHLHGVAAARLLRYVRSPTIPVTTYVHADDPGLDALDPDDRARLLARTERFLVAGDVGGEVVVGLRAAGVDPARIEAAPEPLRFPPPPVAAADRAASRGAAGLPVDAVVVAVPGVDDWPAMPDPTPSLAWELERAAGPAAPLLLWYGVPDDGGDRWTLDHDIDLLGLRTLRPVPALPEGVDVLDVADVLVVPMRTTVTLADGLVEGAAARQIPVACFDGDPVADEVRARGGIVVPRADVRAMATELARITADRAALRRAGARAWRTQLADLERLVALEVPAP